MKLNKFFLIVTIIAGAFLTANAREIQQNQTSSIISAYRYYKDINNTPINAPTVTEVSFASDFIERFDFAIFDKATNSFEPYFFKQETIVNEIPVSVSASPSNSTVGRINDNNIRTYADFPLLENVQGRVQITLSSAQLITSSILTVLLDNNVALPTSVEIRAVVDGQNRIVVANQKMDQQTVYFPQTTSNKWTVVFSFSQPLRISELRLNQDNAVKLSARAVRFLAQPSHSYRIYFNPDRSVSAPVGEAGNLSSVKDIFIVSDAASQNNPNYIIADVDKDGVPDILDNCVSTGNSDQKDINSNGRGDVCDDFDQDGLINFNDNCPNNPNINQKDSDSDGIGDICDKEESRITEQYPWIPWVGIGFAAVVLIILLILTVKSSRSSSPEGN